jgi:hypothetical protein
LDWEKSKIAYSADGSKVGVADTVVAWRSIFVANELNEIQVNMRKIYPETTLIWFAFLWVGMGWQYITQSNPDLQKFHIEYEQQNSFLKFFMVALLMICIAICQLVVFWFFAYTKGSDTASFVNFCTVANVSVLFMEYHNYGYYIHGKAPWDESDLPHAWLKKELDSEANAQRRSRKFSDQQ